ncbi:Ff.00g015390.m01.CDS01 [Fusarium sp. VM40]|nr:Ff.00g015390.m01.CDS01 [Fusarium sp. VM40]
MNGTSFEPTDAGASPEPKDDDQNDVQQVGLARYMNSLARELRDYYYDTGEEQILDEAIEMAEKATLVTSTTDPNLPAYYNNLALLLWDRYGHTWCSEALDQAIDTGRQAIDLSPRSCLKRLRYMDNLAYMLCDQFDMSNDQSSLEECVKVQQEVVEGCPESHSYRAEYVDHLGRLLIDFASFTKSVGELEKGIDQVRQSVRRLPKDYQHRAQCLSTLAEMLQEEYGLQAGRTDPAEAVQLAKEAVDSTPEDTLERATYQSKLGHLLADKFHFGKDMCDIDEAIHLLKEATKEYYEDDTSWISRSIDLGHALEARSTATGSASDLDEAIEIARGALEASLEDTNYRLRRALRLASRLKERYIRSRLSSDLEEAIQVINSNLEAAPGDDPNRGHAFHILGNSIGDRFSISGSIPDLDEAIKLAQKAVEATPTTDVEYFNFLQSLAACFADRYDRTSAIADLDEAIRIMERVVNETPETNLTWLGFVYNLGGIYRTRYTRLGHASDLERAIDLAQETVGKCNVGNASRHLYLSRLATCLKTRYDRERSIWDLEDAIKLEYEALEATTEYHVDFAGRLHQLGTSLVRKYMHTKDIADLDEAIGFSKRAVNAEDGTYRYRAESLHGVGCYLQKRSEFTGSKEDQLEAIEFYRDAILQTQSAIKTRIDAARRAIILYMLHEDWKQAYEIAEIAIHLMPKLILRSLQNADKEELLPGLSGLSSDAAGLALEIGKGPVIALSMLERGRGMLAAALDDLHTDIDALKDKHPDLATKFVALRNKLGQDEKPYASSDLAWNQGSNQRYEAGEEFDKLVNQIRTQPGFEDFLLPPTESQIMWAATPGPIVVVNTCLLRCDAIIIERHQIRSISLPDFDRHSMIKFSSEGTLKSSLALEWLWNCVARPVLDALGFTKTPAGDWPHVWWIMTGFLTKFPIHAAGLHTKGCADSVLDRVVSSYHTSVQSIVRGRKRPAPTRPLHQALLVGMETTPGSSSLPNASKEIDAVRKVCETMSIDPIELKPRKKDIMSQLLESEIFHYAGHAYTDSNDPAESYLCLEADKADCITVSNLLDINLQRQSPFLAYLSACGTGEMQNNHLVDEGIHLISGFQLLGFRHVIGTLWAVMDELCVQMARLFYEELRDKVRTDRAVAEGLHTATRKLRDDWLDARETDHSATARRVNEGISTGERATEDMRDVLACEEEVAWPHWIPYVHYGV